MILFFLLMYCLFSSYIQAHILIVPYPYYNREYAVNQTKYIAVNQSPIVCSDYNYSHEKIWEFVFNGVGFYRQANRAYDLFENNKYVAAAFHGRSEFDLSDLSPNGRIIYIKNNTNSYKDILNNNEYIRYEGLVKPMYQFSEYGVTLAGDIVRKLSEKTTLLLQLRIPIISKSICHNKGWADIKYDDNTLQDDRVYIDSHNKYFKVRMDYIFEKEIIPRVRSISDLKKGNGIVFLDTGTKDYFLEKPYFLDTVYYENEQEQNLYSDLDYNHGHKLEEDDFDMSRNNKRINFDNWYAMTEFDEVALPTKNSLDFYTKLLQSIQSSSNDFLNAITRGKFFGKNYTWNSVKINYVAPLDIQLNITKIFSHENIIIQALCAVVIPVKNNILSQENYILRSFFRDQYAFRLGSQMTYDINRYYKILFYGSWQYYFPCNQIIPAIFENINAYGLSPLYLQGKVSWYEWYFATHLVIKYNDHAGVDLGYQYIFKEGDTIVPECENFYLVNGEKEKLDYTRWKAFSTSIANLLGINFYYYMGAWQFDIGIRGLLFGKNIMKIQEYALRVGLDF